MYFLFKIWKSGKSIKMNPRIFARVFFYSFSFLLSAKHVITAQKADRRCDQKDHAFFDQHSDHDSHSDTKKHQPEQSSHIPQHLFFGLL
jgi:hypothetical protein